MFTEEQIKEAFPEQWGLMLTGLNEGEEFNGNIIKAVSHFFQQMSAPSEHVDLMLAMWLSCPIEVKKQILDHVATNNKEKIMSNMLEHIKENEIEVNVVADVKGWIQYFFCIALVSQLTKIAEKMKEIK